MATSGLQMQAIMRSDISRLERKIAGTSHQRSGTLSRKKGESRRCELESIRVFPRQMVRSPEQQGPLVSMAHPTEVPNAMFPLLRFWPFHLFAAEPGSCDQVSAKTPLAFLLDEG